MDWLEIVSTIFDKMKEKHLDKEFQQLKTNFDRICFLDRHRPDLLGDRLETELSSRFMSTKDSSKAKDLRKKGNDYFVKKDLERAAGCYRGSIAASQINSEDLALAYGNLSAVLFELNDYSQTIRSIEVAEPFYPHELKYKLIFRRAVCHQKLNQFERCEEDLKYCRELLRSTSSLDRKKFQTWTKEIDQLEQQITTVTTVHQDPENYLQSVEHSKQTVPNCLSMFGEDVCSSSSFSSVYNVNLFDSSFSLFNGAHQSISCASSAIDLVQSDGKGRSLIAREDIPQDALLMIERPYAHLLLPELVYAYCDHCLTPLIVPWMCPQCSHMLFCSESCQQRALNGYHQYECQSMEILQNLGIGFLAYRTVTMTGPQIFWTSLNQPAENTGIYRSDYPAIQQLVTHSEQMSPDDLFYYSLTAYFLGELIKSTNFLSLCPMKLSDGKQILLASIFLQHLEQMICNAQTIFLREENRRVDEPSEIPLASAILPTCALMNHSCVPNIRCVFEKGFFRVFARRSIKRDEEIFNCYGPQKSQIPSREERQELLANQYFFQCQCEGCV